MAITAACEEPGRISLQLRPDTFSLGLFIPSILQPWTLTRIVPNEVNPSPRRLSCELKLTINLFETDNHGRCAQPPSYWESARRQKAMCLKIQVSQLPMTLWLLEIFLHSLSPDYKKIAASMTPEERTAAARRFTDLPAPAACSSPRTPAAHPA